MNTTTSPANQETAHLEKLRAQISTDIEDMQQKESSLREYEQRLRLLVEQAHNSRAPQSALQHCIPSAPNPASVDAECEKYHRAYALLEAARRGLCDDRLALRDREGKIHLREVEIARREARVKLREQELEAQAQAQAQAQARALELAQPKPKASFTAAPFLAARNLLMRHS